MRSVFCGKCGIPLESGVKFCPQCGQVVTDVAEIPPAVPKPTIPNMDFHKPPVLDLDGETHVADKRNLGDGKKHSFCALCGIPLESGVKYCPQCGHAVIAVAEDRKTTPLPRAKFSVVKLLVNSLTMFLLLFMACCPVIQLYYAKSFGTIASLVVAKALPLFLMLNSVGLMFGVGGASAISRALGKGDTMRVRQISVFSFWGSLISTLLLSVCLYSLLMPISRLYLSSDSYEIGLYVLYGKFLCIAAPFAAVSNCFTCLLMAEGRSYRALLVQVVISITYFEALYFIIGCVFHGNIHIYPPIYFFIAFCINFTALYFLLITVKAKTALSIRFSDFSWKDGVMVDVLKAGVPSLLAFAAIGFLQTLLPNYGSSLPITIFMAVGLGAIPSLGFCFGRGDRKTFWKTLTFSGIFLLCVSVTMAVVCYLRVSEGYITYPPTIGFFFGLVCLLGSVMQSTERGPAALVPYSLYAVLAYFSLRETVHNWGFSKPISISPLWEILIDVAAAGICAWALFGEKKLRAPKRLDKTGKDSGEKMRKKKKKLLAAGCAGVLVTVILIFAMTRNSPQKLVGEWVKEDPESKGSMPYSLTIYSDGTYRGDYVEPFVYWEGTYVVKGKLITFDVIGDVDKRYYWKLEGDKLTFYKDDGTYGKYIRSLEW